MTEGSKTEIHIWQHQQIEEYYYDYEKLPPLNKSFNFLEDEQAVLWLFYQYIITKQLMEIINGVKI